MRLSFILVVGLALSSLPGAHAADAPIPHGSVELVPENQWIVPGARFTLGLHFKLEEGWHIYWVNPGDSGQPPVATWQLPAGITAGEIEWPAPHRLGTSTIVDFGYTGDVMLLAPMRAADTVSVQSAAQIGADLKVLVCREICVPGKAKLSLSIPIKMSPSVPDERTRESFSTARKSLPVPTPAGWKFHVSDEKDSFLFFADTGRKVTGAFFFPLVESQVDNSAPQMLVPTATGFELKLRKSDQLLAPIRQLTGVLELSPGGEAYVVNAPITGARK